MADGAASLGKEYVEAHAGGRSATLHDFRALELHGAGRTRTRKSGGDKGHDAQFAALRGGAEGAASDRPRPARHDGGRRSPRCRSAADRRGGARTVSDRVLILGGTGMLGHEAISRFMPHFEVHASVRDPELAAQYELPATLHAFDAYEPQALTELLDVVDPAVVLNCIGIVKQLEDASRPLPAITVNSLFPHQLAAMCEHKGCRLIHISTDCVFSGRLPLGQSYREEDEADARDLYGLTKLLGEVKGRS